MQTEQIVALLVAERDRLSQAIEALQGSVKRRGRPPVKKSPASTVDHNAPNVWAAIKAGKAKSPFAKKAK